MQNQSKAQELVEKLHQEDPELFMEFIQWYQSQQNDSTESAAPQNEPSSKLLAIIEQLMRDPSQLQEIAEELQREDPELFIELVQWIQNQE